MLKRGFRIWDGMDGVVGVGLSIMRVGNCIVAPTELFMTTDFLFRLFPSLDGDV